jgi:hypothetical protein
MLYALCSYAVKCFGFLLFQVLDTYAHLIEK